MSYLCGGVQGHQRRGRRYGRGRAAHVYHQPPAAGQHAGQDQPARVHRPGHVAPDGRVRVAAVVGREPHRPATVSGRDGTVGRHAGEELGMRVTSAGAVNQNSHAAGRLQPALDDGPQPPIPQRAPETGRPLTVGLAETSVAHVVVLAAVHPSLRFPEG